MILGCVAIIIIYIIYSAYYEITQNKTLRIIYIACVLLGIIIEIVSFVTKYNKPWLKYVILGYLELNAIISLSYADPAVMICLLILPIILSCKYYDEKITTVTIVTTCVLIVIMTIVSTSTSYNVTLFPNLNYVVLKEGKTIEVKYKVYECINFEDVDMKEYLTAVEKWLVGPSIILVLGISYVAYLVAKAGREMMFAHEQAAMENEKIQSELRYAAKIQTDMLPKVDLKDDSIHVFAGMTPAKEVGGDFYDYYTIDEDTTAIVIGDVSDKGVPAALFMSKCTTLIKGFALAKQKVNEIFDLTNKRLCENNESNMFVTSFLGVIHNKENKLICSNAGHCYPILVDDEGCRYLKIKPNLVLGSLDNVTYNQVEVNLKKGSRIILYTDGVTEAMNKENKLYGEERLLNFVKSHKDDNEDIFIKNLIEDIKLFADGADQNDDITILVCDYK